MMGGRGVSPPGDEGRTFPLSPPPPLQGQSSNMDSINALRPIWPTILVLGFALGVLPGSANAAWPPLGVRLCEVPGEQLSPMAWSDGFGGAFVCWSDYRGVLVDGVFDADLYIQRVSVDGQIAPGWPHDGFESSAAPTTQWRLDRVADG